VNRDLVRAAKRVLVLGSGNVGLIAAYHALQAGIEVAAIVEILGKVNGYKVHADKIVRAGVPVYLNTTVMAAEGRGRVQRAVVAAVGKDFRPIPETLRAYEVDTVLIAAGLSPCDEFYRQARGFGFLAVSSGDAEEIAEASSAMFGGRIAAFALGKLLGCKVEADPSWIAKREVLKSRPGEVLAREAEKPGPSWKPVFFCTEEIPCNPCASVCPTRSIRLRARKGNILDLPYFQGSECRGCMACVAICPGLAVSMMRRIDEDWAEIVLPYEFPADFGVGTSLSLLDSCGVFLEEAAVLRKTWNRKNKTWLLGFKVSSENAGLAIGIRVQRPEATEPCGDGATSAIPDDAVVCRCEKVTVGEMVSFIRENRIRDANQLKTLRVGMGSCGSKTCSVLLPQVFRKAGVDPSEVAGLTQRPLCMETGMAALVNEGRETRIEADASQRGAP
jgi:Fe-S-cluster-containing hydrogenase component 2